MKLFKGFIFSFLLIFSSSFYATDLVVNSSGQSGTYTTLSAALTAAASSGDRILIPSTITFIEDITINKSVDIMPLTADNYFYLEGDINVTSNAGLEIRILGMNFSGDLVCSSGTATETNRCHLYFIDCNVTDPGVLELNAEISGLVFHVLYCYMPDVSVSFKFGEIIASHLDNFRVSYTDNNNYNDTIKIIANIFESSTTKNISVSFSAYSSDIVFSSFDSFSHYYFISNNYFRYGTGYNSASLLSLFASDTVGNGFNTISNNTLVNNNNSYTNSARGNCISFNQAHSYSNGSYTYWNRPNTNVINNIFQWNSYYNNPMEPAIGLGTNGYTISGISLPFVKYNVFSKGDENFSTSPGNFTQGNIHGLFPTTSSSSDFTIDNYNYTGSSSLYVPGSGYFDYYSGKGLSGVGVNTGLNSASSYDLDMTRNDPGTYGGPYSMENYWDSTATGKARVYNLDMPFEIWSGQTPTIKASAVHTK